MKKTVRVLLCALLLAALSACAKTPEPAPLPVPEDPGEPLRLESLAVEVSKTGGDARELLSAVRTLPEALQTALAAHGVEVEEVTLSVGSSPAATVQALERGSVDVAFLPAGELAAQETAAPVILTSGPLFWDQGEELKDWRRAPEEAPLVPCYRTLICAAPTEYGTNLASRKSPTWAELSRARWGLLAADSLPGRRAVDLWLADRYDGKTTADLPDVTVYGSFEDLLLAAAAGEIDLLPMDETEWENWESRWTQPVEEGGLGRPVPVWEDLTTIGLTERFYDRAAAVRPGADALADARFAQALAEALSDLHSDPAYSREVRQLSRAAFGKGNAYAPAPENALAATRRLLALEET